MVGTLIDLWLDLPEPATLAILAAFFTTTGVLVVWLGTGRPWRVRTAGLSGVVAPFFSSVAILFALLTGFLASDVSQRNRLANQAVWNEAAAAARIQALSLAARSDMAQARTLLRSYLQSVVADEWPLMVLGEASKVTAGLLSDLLETVVNPDVAAEAGSAAQTALVNAVVAMDAARSNRLSASNDQTNGLKWLTVLLLGAITQLAIGLVHLDKPRAMIAAVTLFSVAAFVTLGLLALQERLFSGWIQVSPAPLTRVVALIPA